MAHGTGYYSERQWNADIVTDEYVVMFFRTKHYWYPDMSDSYEPTSEWTDKYSVEVGVWYEWKKGRKEVSDMWRECDMQSLTDISKDEANKIWWNIKNRNLKFEDIKRYFQRRKAEMKEDALRAAEKRIAEMALANKH